jgi:hypothetical protein
MSASSFSGNIKVLASSIGWILVASGVITAGAGLAALLYPRLFLWVGFGADCPPGSEFFVRHWGVLILVVAGLIVYSAFVPAVRVPVLVAAATEKFAIGLLVFFGPMKRTSAMTILAIGDGIFAILYVAYLAGL